ncbi:MAG: helicase-exonuclease AddAB subunit AddA [Ruminococcus sp.]|nr:helicase-exonuclease AddAB subunit AddA [Ruminococcus sp.]
MAWTSQQENAINARNSSIIVSAAAGSGKTAVLTERLAKLIADPDSGVRADRMIIVTFTNDAAAEMKKRLDMKLRALINDDPANEHLLKQQVLLQSAKISTINSFCFELIRDNITDQGITSGFGVLDDTDNAVIRSQAMDDLLNYYSENDYEKISFMYDRFCIRSYRSLSAVISKADEFLASVTLREKWLELAEKEYSKPFSESVYYKSLIESVKRRVDRGVRIADECLNMVTAIFPDRENYPQAEKSFAVAEDDYDKLCELQKIFDSGRFTNEEEAARLTAFGDLVRVTAKTPHNKSLRELYKAKREQLKKIPAGVIDSISSVESDYRESAEVTMVLTEMLRKYQEFIWKRKCEKNSISFDDGERLAIELLADIDENGRIVPSETARQTAEHYDIIMIDEYQDSNNKEDLIFKLISKNFKHDSSGEPMYGDNVFLVGDVKQSIYRFRLANPRNFINTLRSSEPYTAESKSPNKAILLNRNFRSSEGVIDFVNYVFGQIMTERCGDIDYNEDEMLYFGAEEYRDCVDTQAHIAFIVDDPDEDEDDKADTSDINTEAVYTAGKIAEMIESGTEVILKDGTKRPCIPSDFSILVRGNKYINVYAKELEKVGVPAKGKEESGYLRAREIAVLIDMLRIINNPLLDIPMTAVMTSPMYMFTIPEIAYIKSLDREKAIYPILLGIASGDYPECDDMFFIGRINDFLGALESFRLDAVTMTIGELIGRIYDTTDFISVMQLYNDGEKKRANLRVLVQYASNYESTVAFEGSGGLGGFLRHIDRVMENGDYTQGKVSSSSGDYVTIQTLHGSKGLEYPFVFIAETSHKFRFDSDTVMCSSDGRIGYTLYDPKIVRKYKTFQHTMLTEEERRDTRSEEMRLLYVGMTRARQKLFINLKCGEKTLKRIDNKINSCAIRGWDISENVGEAENYADWLWLSLFRHSEFTAISEQVGVGGKDFGAPAYISDKNLFDYEIVCPEKKSVFEEAAEQEETAPNEEICAELRSYIESKYDRSLSEMPAKLSVTQITKKFKDDEEDFDFKLKRPMFKSSGSRLTGAERGTAIHTFFQYCDFYGARNDISSEIENMVEKGYISAAQAESIDRANASAFFDSDLYERMSKAKEVWREKKFMVAVSQLDIENKLMEVLSRSDGMIKGIVDLMFEEEDGIVLVDYKSDRGISAERLAERYDIQLRLYKSAIELTMNKKVKAAYLYSFELKRSVHIF